MREKKIQIGIIGHFANGQTSPEGQTVKTKTLYDSLINNYSNEFEIEKVDTWLVKKHPVKFFLLLFWCLFKSSKVIVIVSAKGRKILFPILYYASRVMNVKVFHYAIGGRLVEEIIDHPKYKEYVAGFAGNWMESNIQVQQLRSMGINNAEYIPNFKKLNLNRSECIQENSASKYQLHCCTFSRVLKEKGISDAIDAIAELNNRYGKELIKLDIYGSINSEYKEEFEEKIQKNRAFIEYKGIADSSQSTEIISCYDLLLFPTHYRREGIPGTIIDAFASGVPVLAREWKYGKEMIVHGKNGYLYPYDQPEQLSVWIEYCLKNKELLKTMRNACVASAMNYSEEYVLPIIKARLEK